MIYKIIVLQYNKIDITTFTCDDIYVSLIKSRRWSLSPQGYVVTHVPVKGEFLLHRMIMNPKENEVVDHIDGNKQNCYTANMRNVSVSMNSFARPSNVSSNTGYRGVYKPRHTTKFAAKIQVDHKSIHLGYRDTPEEAYELYLAACMKYYGELPPK